MTISYTGEETGIKPMLARISVATIVTIGELSIEPIYVFSLTIPKVDMTDKTDHSCHSDDISAVGRAFNEISFLLVNEREN